MSLSFMTIPRLLRSSDQGFQFLHMLAFHCAGIRYLLHILNDDLIKFVRFGILTSVMGAFRRFSLLVFVRIVLLSSCMGCLFSCLP